MANIRKRGNSYQIRVGVGYKPDGTQISRSMTWTPAQGMSERQIEKELNRQAVIFEEECRSRSAGGMVKFEIFAEEWFSEYAKSNLRNTTFNFLYHQRLRVYRAIGDTSMEKITVRQLQEFINSLSKDGANEVNGKPLSPKTVRHVLSLVSDIFAYAVRMGIVRENPCVRVVLPKLVRKEKKIYTVEETVRLMELLRKEPVKYRAFFFLLIYSGCRRGELLGLEWRDVDFANCLISIRRTSCYTPDRGTYTDTTKTEQSKRTLKLPQEVMDILCELRDFQLRQADIFGDKWVESGRLFTKETGEPQHPNTSYHWLEKFCARNGLPFYGLHSFRHLFASLLVGNGVDIVTVSGVLGHSAVSTTSNIYCHMLEDARVRASDTVASALRLSDS
ncbi:MAG: site-specific integrase [Eubacterium sp.]|nr:site-specific integrase [Eubacterium sp.]